MLPDDTNKVNVLNKLCFLCAKNDSKNAIDYGEKALNLSQKLAFKKGIALSYYAQGYAYRLMGKYKKAISFQVNAQTKLKKLNDSINLAQTFRELGVIHRRKGNFLKSIDYFLTSLKLFETLKYKRGESDVAASIGLLYSRQRNFNKSLEFHNKALNLHQTLNSKPSIAMDYNNLGDVYAGKKEYGKALGFYEKSQKIKKELNDTRGIAIVLSNIGYTYIKQNKFKSAIEFCKKSLKLRDELGLRKSKMFPLLYLAEAHAALKEFDKAIFYGTQALNIAKGIGAKFRAMEMSEKLSIIYKESGDYKNALDLFQKHKAYADSVFNEKKTKKIAEVEAKYKTEKQAQEITFFKKEDENNKTLLRQRTNLVVAITFGALLLIILAMVLYQSNQRKQHTNQVLVLQKQEIEVKTEEILAQRDMLEQQHKDIRDSINYARKIQTAILPLPEEISAAIPEHFIFYKPRDIVSGDFYWFAAVRNEETGNTKYVISASDCTGHGVPGAFMSMIGNDLLNDLVKARQITQPDVILNKLHKGVRKALHQEISENTDGMDISLCVIDPTEKTISYAGANSALVYVKEGERTRLAPDQTSIGGDMPSFQKGFAAHTISYADAPIMCYLYTDGYRDQFGGERGKKFLRSRLQELIFYISQLSMQEQRRQVEETMHTWMTEGGFEQMDDMLVMGFKLG